MEEACGAQFHNWFGVSVPQDYGDIRKELEAARTQAAFFDLSFRSLLDVQGKDAADFLERLCSNHITDLKDGKSVPAGFLNAQARVVSLANILRKPDGFWIEIQIDQLSKLKNFLEKFIIVDDVRLTDRTETLALIGVEGTKAGDVLRQNDLHAETYSCRLASSEGFLLVAPRGNAGQIWDALSRRPEIQPAGMEALNILRIENGVPWYGLDVSEDYLLPETGMEEAIHYNKGCYTGQEIVARVKSRGQLRRRLARFLIESQTPPPAGTPILFNGNPSGHITSAAFDPTCGKIRALGYVKMELIEKKYTFDVSGRPAKLMD